MIDGRRDEWVTPASSDGHEFVRLLETRVSYHKRVARAVGNGIADELRKLSQLSEEGILRSDDWEQAKIMFLGKPETRRTKP